MSPNIEILKNFQVAAHDRAMMTLMRVAVLLTGLSRRVKVRRVKPVTVAKHHLGGRGESVYVWTLLDQIFGTEDTQEIRQQAATRRGERRRVNGFLTVDMLLGRPS